MLEVEMILTENDLDLRRHREQLKAIRRGEVPEEDIRRFFAEKEVSLEKVYHESKLRYKPDKEAIRTLLLSCLEHHYGSLDKCVVQVGKADLILQQIQELLDSTS